MEPQADAFSTLTALWVAEPHENVAHGDETKVQPVGTIGAEGFELSQEHDRDDEVGHPAARRGDGRSRRADLEGEEFGLIPH